MQRRRIREYCNRSLFTTLSMVSPGYLGEYKCTVIGLRLLLIYGLSRLRRRIQVYCYMSLFTTSDRSLITILSMATTNPNMGDNKNVSKFEMLSLTKTSFNQKDLYPGGGVGAGPPCRVFTFITIFWSKYNFGNF